MTSLRRSIAKLRRPSRGQSMVEFAIILPLLLLIILFGLDFGRVFLGWVTLNNVAREAANFAAANPDAWNTANPDGAAQAEYERLVRAEATQIDCTLQDPIPAPSFVNGPNGPNAIGTPARVSITCGFRTIIPIGPVVDLVHGSSVAGGAIPVGASAAFPVRNGVIEGIPVAPVVPTPSPSPTPEPTPTPSESPTPSPEPTPTPTPMCKVPNLVGEKVSDVQSKWNQAGFTTQVVFVPQAPNKPKGTDRVDTQDPLYQGGNNSLPCGTTAMSVTWSGH